MTTYYFVSDLHVGGDEALRDVQFEDELLGFLADLEEAAEDEDVELIVNGDVFGLWEFTELEGIAKFDALLERYPDLFEQLRQTGDVVDITVMPGNHDYELAAYDKYVDRLAEFNVTLDQSVALTREVGDHEVWVEHGMQEDANNRIPDFGNPYANPLGYFVNRHFTSKAGQLSHRGRYNWLKDIQSVTPLEQIPEWLMSNYFYREMTPLLRYALLPFLLMFYVSLTYLGLLVLDVTGIWSAPIELVHGLLATLGIVGSLIDAVIVVNVAVIVLLSIIGVPIYLLVRDVRKTLSRFGLFAIAEAEKRSSPYEERARVVFADHPEVAAFVYGHTHRVSLTEVDDRAILNTGTWLKRLERTPTRIGLLPPVFYPSFRLSYFRVTAGDDGAVLVEYDEVAKADPSELSLLERMVSKRPRQAAEIPDRTRIDP
ncbi:metallophosphoesterase [Halobacteriales archaeon Cl-PHB]